jgi:aspartokinase-like uncharacterized kinase
LPDIDAVVKLGGSVLAYPAHFDATIAAIGSAGGAQRLLLVPGGGPFADVVRDVDRQLQLSDDAAHWMAVMAMDQYAHLIASRLKNGVLVSGPGEMARVGQGFVSVLAPFRWLRETDPLPHAWTVTSDSIAAWVAGMVGARRLVLVKAPGASGGDLVDACFSRVLPEHVTPIVVTADHIDRLGSALQGEIDPV